MDRIQLFRSAGLSLDSIVMLLGKKGDELNATLEGRLSSINGEIQALRDQQKIILKILEKESAIRGTRVLTKKIWVSILEAAGLDDAAMENWHIEFEKTSPEAHQDFLETLGISDAEIARIRDRSKAFAH
jgi:DNA-binding transcriptional MerR regulator|tara:strand:+ start:63 stop:452 length:390 start_codon:yes stop_codon:yes gene_type:complete